MLSYWFSRFTAFHSQKRAPKTYFKYFNLIDLPMLRAVFLILAVCYLAQADGVPFQLKSECNKTLDRGNPCSEHQPALKFHMDAETLTCLAFKHKGCGGNENSFASKDECQRYCIPMDMFTCGGNSPPAKRADGTAHCGNGPMGPECPKGSECLMGFATGLCCDSANQDKSRKNYKPDCGPNKKEVKKEQFGFDLILLGKQCSDEFCPSGSSCHQGAFFAYCCH